MFFEKVPDRKHTNRYFFIESKNRIGYRTGNENNIANFHLYYTVQGFPSISQRKKYR